jgi:dipeptidyl aminopeptidase/acylaminoacyl peptidase
MKNTFLLVFLMMISMLSFAQKKVLDHTVYDGWESIKETILQPQGNVISFVVAPQEGDGKLVIQSKDKSWQYTIPRGEQAVFSNNGTYLVGKIKPLFAQTRKAKIDKKKADELPKDSLFIFSINDQKLKVIPSVKSFQLAEKGNDILVYLNDKKGDIAKEGSDLIVYQLDSKVEHAFKNIAQYTINPKGNSVLAYRVGTKQSNSAILLINANDTTGKVINKNFFSANQLAWDDNGTQAAYLIEQDSTSKALQKNYQLRYFNSNLDSGIIISTNNAMPNQYVFGADKKINFSKSGARIILGIQPLLPAKDTSLPEFERVSVDIWNSNESLLQSNQLKTLDASLKSTEPLILNTSNKSLMYVGKVNDREVRFTNEGDGRFVYFSNDSADLHASQWQGFTYKDLYVLDLNEGKKEMFHKSFKGNILYPSAQGNKVVYYDEPKKQYFVYDALQHKKSIIAKDIKFPLFDEEFDMPDDPNAHGVAKWMDDEKGILIYDHFDIWWVDANGNEPSIKLTNGRSSKMVYRFFENNADRKALSKNDLIVLRGFSEKDKSEQIATLNLQNNALSIINQFPMHINNLLGSKYNKELIAIQEDEKTSGAPYWYQINNTSQHPSASIVINTQQKDYNWMSSEIVTWKAYTGKTTEGVLYKPENFDPTKKYPMIVYFYERNNQTLHNYLQPAPTPSRLNIPFFASRGYLVFVPDIWYKKGEPGQSAYDYIVSGTRALIQKGFVDSTKIGLQGQSWGGYQIAYLITKTNLYAAAWAGAPVVNMTSAYGGIRWGPGVNRQFQYEKSQSRIGATLWERQDLYLKNSPLFSLNKVTTPVTIMSNDADDAVPWYQGIEMFTAMKRLNKKIWMLVYNNEAHNLVERRNRKDIQIREQQFFDHYLKNQAMPKWMSEGVPAIMKGRTLGLDY